MKHPIQWLTLDQVLEINQDELNLKDKRDGLLNESLLLSALARPRNMLHYKQYIDIPALSAVFCFGIIKNHPFIDGNKRTGFLSSATFLILNGFDFKASEKVATKAMLNIANGNKNEEWLVDWFRENSIPR